jgi:MiaB/RimO family radical SAM methylthiotransferase
MSAPADKENLSAQGKGTRFFLATLGCKVNQYESRALAEAWLDRGWVQAASPGEAEILLLNTCAVTERAVADSRNLARRLRRAAPGAILLLTGCAAQVLPGEFQALPGPASLIAQGRKASLAALPLSPFPPPPSPGTEDPGEGPAPFPDFRISGYGRSRAVLKVQDGCSHGCAYCIVPLARGPARSRSPDATLAEAGRLLEAGFREIVLSGVNLRQYRHRTGSTPADGRKEGDFWDLLALLEAELAPRWAGRARLRLSSLEPGQLTERALEVLGQSRLLAPHLHLSLQSGSPSVLRRMGRGHYDPARTALFLESLRGPWPVFSLGADILTGFPAETEAEFQETLALFRQLPLSYAHVFPYSPRPGTAAAGFAGQVPEGEKRRRAFLLRQAAGEKRQNFLRLQLALPKMRVIFEKGRGPAPAGDLPRGMNEWCLECRLEGSGEGVSPGELTTVRPLRLFRGALAVALAPRGAEG